MRIRLAERLRKLPLSFFGKRDLADLTTTIMADCAFVEKAFSHFIPELIGALISTVLITGILLVLRRELKLLDVLALGKNQAVNLGVDVDKTNRRLLLGVTILIAIATALVGPISFLGLIIANLSRQLFQTYRHSWLIFGSALLGMIVLVGGQLAVEHLFAYSIPISVLITIGGGFYFLVLLLGKGRQQVW